MLELLGTIFIIIFGTLSHYFYDWSNHNKIIAYFTSVNESTWEHLKLVIAPTFIWMIVEYHFYFNNPNYFISRFISLIIMLLIIPLIFYSYTKFTKTSILYIDISSFFISIILGQLLFSKLLTYKPTTPFINHLGIIGLLLIFFLYIINTYVPPKNFLYKDPLTNKYGIKAHKDNQKE